MIKRDNITRVKFGNSPKSISYFDIVNIEELLTRELDHNIFNNHIIKFYAICVITDGTKGLHSIDLKDYQYNKGSILIVRKDQIHKFYKNNTVKGTLLVFTEDFLVSHLSKPEALSSLQLFNEVLNDPVIHLNNEEKHFQNFLELIKKLEEEYKNNDEHSLRIMKSILHIFIVKLLRLTPNNFDTGNKKYLSEFLTFHDLVEKNCFETKKVSFYADKMNISTKTLNSAIQTIANKTAKVFISDMVILQIKRLLICTNDSIKEISYTSGFEDPTNFCKFFKKNTGVSPETFRVSHK